MRILAGRKLNMTQLFDEKGEAVPVTIVKVAAGTVTQIKTKSKDGYSAIQFGFNEGPKHPNKAMVGHTKKAMDLPLLHELRSNDEITLKVGDKCDINAFKVGETVSLTGVSKGRGYSGVVKRHHFHGSPKTHGHKHDLRAPGSIGATAAQRVFPGRRMAGRMGNDHVTVNNVKIAFIDVGSNAIYVKGAVPGARNGLVFIFNKEEVKQVK